MPINKLKKIMSDLRDPENGCPWDVEQNFQSIVPHTIEEAYEVADAIERGDMQSLKEELGDLLLQVIFYAQMADEEGYFNFDDVVEAINKKLVDRHPHVFGDMDIKTAKEQEESWERLKKEERAAKAKEKGEVASVLDDVAVTLPALTRSVKLQKRAAKTGFDWPDLNGVFAKIDEELGELKEAIENNSNIEEESGDLLFVISNLIRKIKVDPEVALRGCNSKFEKRFRYIEKRLDEQGRDIENCSLEDLDKLWEEAKLF
jgi:ATP diphosphatase